MKLVKREADKGYLDCSLWIPKSKVNEQGVKNSLTFQFTSRTDEPFFIFLWKETKHHIIVPRAYWDVRKFDFEVIDCRPLKYTRVNVKSSIILDNHEKGETYQQEAFDALWKAQGGILQLKCGGGKTVIALELIARMKVPALIVVDTTQLLEQWTEDIEEFLTIPKGVGRIQASEFDWRKPVVLATYKTLANRSGTMPEQVRRWFGLILWDEAHHVAAPTFSKAADIFYGKRIGLTATATRDDGLHIIYDAHLGPILYKNLKQTLTPKIYFLQTGLSLNLADPKVKNQVVDKNGEVHLKKLAGYFGTWKERLNIVIDEAREAVDNGRKVLVICDSINEVMNCAALWTYGSKAKLYTDIPIPTPKQAGVSLPIGAIPKELSKRRLARINLTLRRVKKQLQSNKTLNPTKRGQLDIQRKALELELKQHDAFKAIEKELRRRQREYVKKLTAKSTAGMMTSLVTPKKRTEMQKNLRVTFSIAKYGREGLDDKKLDTVIIADPMSSKNILQQVMGRTQRPKAITPLLIILEDSIGKLIGMCNKLRTYLRNWPEDEGGPYTFQQVVHQQKEV